MNERANRLVTHRRLWLLFGAVALYLLLASYQLGLPGLHYDEAKEAGVNAMELLTDAPVTAFRDSTVNVFGMRLPLMVQDYIGALNVYLALPFLALSGIGVPNLRMTAVLIGLAALFLTERATSEWMVACSRSSGSVYGGQRTTPISLAGLIGAWLLAVSPSFIFWSRQGIFVTNLMQPLCLLCVWQGVRWMHTGRDRALLWAALAGGLALYAKLLTVWIVAPFTLMVLIWWVNGRTHRSYRVPALSPRLIAVALVVFLLPLVPLLVFNLQTGGTIIHFLGNMGSSYYGVDNSDIGVNLGIRLGQVAETLEGGQFWYLGAVYNFSPAPWFAMALVLAGLWACVRCAAPPLLLVSAAVLASIATISDLFITHYALLYPFMITTIAIAVESLWQRGNDRERVSVLLRWSLAVILTVWISGNLYTSVRYHRALGESGGLADHSDASYHLSYYLRYNGLGAPIALDWGMDAPVRYLSRGVVRPIEIFGYDNLDSTDNAFRARLAQFIQNPDNVYLLHAPDYTVFQGRRDTLIESAAELGLTAEKVEEFNQRNGQPLFEVWRVRGE